MLCRFCECELNGKTVNYGGVMLHEHCHKQMGNEMYDDEQLQVMSELSGQLADCTIQRGVVIEGERIGAIADIDLFGAFTIDTRAAIETINRQEGTNIKARPGDLWETYKRDTMYEIGKEAQIVDDGKEARIALYRQRAENGLGIFDGTPILEGVEE